MNYFESTQGKLDAFLSQQKAENSPAMRQHREYERIMRTPPPIRGNIPHPNYETGNIVDKLNERFRLEEAERERIAAERDIRIIDQSLQTPHLARLNVFFNLGKPLTDEILKPDIRYNLAAKFVVFEQGTAYWIRKYGFQIVYGAIGGLYKTMGNYRDKFTSKYQPDGSEGYLGYPIQGYMEPADEIDTVSSFSRTTGKVRRFEHGSIYWSPKTGAQPIHGGISDCYESLDATSSKLGFPIKLDHEPLGEFGAAKSRFETEGRVRRFEGGSIYWSPKYGAYPVWGEIGAHFESTGGTSGQYGFPTSYEYSADDGSNKLIQNYEGGRIVWTPPKLY